LLFPYQAIQVLGSPLSGERSACTLQDADISRQTPGCPGKAHLLALPETSLRK